MSKLTKIVLVIVVFSSLTLAQWEVSGTFNYKNEIPKKGIGIQVSRNLPFQFASFGIKVRFGIDLFRETGVQEINGKMRSRNFLSEDIQLDLISTLFFRHLSPYFGLRLGTGHYSVNQFNEYMFLLGVLTGVKVPITTWLHPMLEINVNNYFNSFDEKKIGRNISSVQFIGRIGVIIKL